MLKETVKGMTIAAMVASMFAATTASAKDADTAKGGKTVKCSGVNECKGKGACAGKSNSCAGGNACKGQGWIKLTEKECKAKGGKVIE